MSTSPSVITGCPLCRAADPRPLGALPAAPGTAILHCAACNYAFLHPIPDDDTLRAYYAKDYAIEFGAADADNPGFVANKARKALDRWRFLDERAIRPRGPLLEVGCAEGEFLRACAQRGMACVGVEPDPRLARRAAHAAGCPVLSGMFPLPLPVERFGAVASFHVVEHVPDPVAFLRACVDRLEPGGMLYIATPDLENVGLKPTHPVFRPCHLVYFSAASLRRAMLDAGCLEADVVRSNVCGKPELKAIGRV